jgi:hypothetical protein
MSRAKNNVETLNNMINVSKYGAKGDGVTDDTVAINAALSAVYNTGGNIHFPAGTYLYSGGGQLGNGVVVTGDGRNTSIIKSITASPTNGYLFKAAGTGSGIKSMGFRASVTQTTGSYVWLSGPESFIEDFHITGDFNGVYMTGNVSRIRHGRFQDGASGSIRIKAEGGDNSQLIDDVLMGAQLSQISSAGIRVRNSTALIITNTSVIQQGVGLLVDPTTNTASSNTADGSVYSLYVDTCFFDNNTNGGIVMNATGNANIVRCRFANTWASSSGEDGIYIVNAGSGIVQGIHFESCHSVLNAASGAKTGGNVSDVAFLGGEYCANLYGFYFNNTITNLKIANATIGAGAGLAGNTNWGVVFDASATASDYISITNNVMLNNGSGAIYITPVTGTNTQVTNNLGVTNAFSSWTPSITFDTPGNLAVTYSSRYGVYKRIDNMVYISFVIITSSFSKTTSAGSLRITGLPFTSGINAEGAVELQGVTKTGYTNYTLNITASEPTVIIKASGSGQLISSVNAGDMPTGGNVVLRGSITYMI